MQPKEQKKIMVECEIQTEGFEIIYNTFEPIISPYPEDSGEYFEILVAPKENIMPPVP